MKYKFFHLRVYWFIRLFLTRLHCELLSDWYGILYRIHLGQWKYDHDRSEK